MLSEHLYLNLGGFRPDARVSEGIAKLSEDGSHRGASAER